MHIRMDSCISSAYEWNHSQMLNSPGFLASHLLAAGLGRLAGKLQAELLCKVHHGLCLRHERLQVV